MEVTRFARALGKAAIATAVFAAITYGLYQILWRLGVVAFFVLLAAMVLLTLTATFYGES